MWDSLLEFLEGAGYVLDTPGAYTRGLLAGRPGERVSGRDMLQDWGVLGENQEGLDWGDAAGFGAELLADPLNLIGAGWLKNIGKGRGIAQEANAASDLLRAQGAMPEEIAELTKIVDETGQPKTMYHGTPSDLTSARQLDPSKAGRTNDPGWYGEGMYFTEDLGTAEGFAGLNSKFASTKRGKALPAYIDSRNPYEMPSISREEFMHDFLNAPNEEKMIEDALAESMPELDAINRQLSEFDRNAALEFLLDSGVDLDEVGLTPYSNLLDMQANVYRRAEGAPARWATQNLKDQGFDSAVLYNEPPLFWSGKHIVPPAGAPQADWDAMVSGSQEYFDTPYRPAEIGPIEEMVVYDPSQIYEPMIAPKKKPVPSYLPPLATLLSHHGLRASQQDY